MYFKDRETDPKVNAAYVAIQKAAAAKRLAAVAANKKLKRGK